MSSVTSYVEQLYEQGFCVLPGYYDARETQQMRDIMDDYWKSQGSPSLAAQDFGFTVHPMLPNVPQMARFLGAPEVVEILGNALRDDVRLAHLGARTSGPQSAQRIPWHNHYSWDSPAWDSETLPKRDRLERILAGVYVDGTNAEAGTLIALPRRYNDPLSEPAGGTYGEWPGEVRVEAPEGSIAIFDTALWHTAERGTSTKMRRLWGGHYQGWNDPRPHPEDNEVDAAEIADQKNADPVLKSLLDRPTVATRP